MIIRFLTHNLRSYVERSTLERMELDGHIGHFPRKTKITNFYDTLFDEYVLGFEVTMDDAVVGEVE